MEFTTTVLMAMGVLLLLVLVGQQLFKGTHAKERAKWLARFKTFPYHGKWYLLTIGERAFYEALLRAVGPDLYVFAKVRLFDFLWVPIDQEYRQDYLNQVLPQHVDFLLCDRLTVAPKLVIEFEDGTPRLFEGPERDTLLEAVLVAAKIPILRVTPRDNYEEVELGKLVRKTMASTGNQAGPGQASTPSPTPAPTPTPSA